MIALTSLTLFSCSFNASKPIVILTDSPEMLVAVELFNASHTNDFAEIHFEANLATDLAERLADKKLAPSLVLGSGLNSSAVSGFFQPIDSFLSQRSAIKKEFYPGLLRGGVIDGRQIFLPISFNLILVSNSKPNGESGSEPGNAPVITMEEIGRRAREFNSPDGSKEKMGFSPSWPDNNFLFQWVDLSGAGFTENQGRNQRQDADGRTLPLTWNDDGLDKALSSLSAFIADTNGNPERQDSFEFKYLFAPGYRNVESGKILFTALRSDSYFLLPMLDRSRLEFRYFSESGQLAIDESIRYAGIPKRAPQGKAAGRFLAWFYSADTQRQILEKASSLRLSESQFGVAGGFSSIIKVTETVLPEFYPDMADHLPPSTFLEAPRPMPPRWEQIKRDTLLPWLRSAASGGVAVPASGSLTAALSTWLDGNPEQH